MQSVLSRIWTRVTVSISYDNNHYTMGTSAFRINIQIAGTQLAEAVEYTNCISTEG